MRTFLGKTHLLFRRVGVYFSFFEVRRSSLYSQVIYKSSSNTVRVIASLIFFQIVSLCEQGGTSLGTIS